MNQAVPTRSTTTPDAGRVPSPDDDIHDSTADLARWSQLADKLRDCADVIEPAFRKADSAALRHQGYHRQLARWASLFGTAAVVFAILQLAFAEEIGTHVMSVAEVIAAVLATVAVVMGLRVAFQTRWLVERNTAERLRLAKFRYLIKPEVWCGDPEIVAQQKADLEKEVAQITSIQARDVHHWVEHDAVPTPPRAVLELSNPISVGKELLDYYLARRLRYQRRFFEKRAQENLRLETFARFFSLALFVGSVGAVLLHFGYDLFDRAEHLNLVSRWLIVIAASLPVLGGAIRTWQSTYQFALNTDRYRAKAVALASIDLALDHATAARSEFLGFWLTEQTLENEHREWLRLMLEAEWYA
jgi:hypothetical protein